MWKWIVGAALVLVVLLVGVCWSGYRRLTAGGDAVAVSIGAPPAKIFASLANADSMAVWMSAGSTVTASHKGMLVVGDTVHVEQMARARREQYTWTVAALVPDQLLVLEMRSDTSGQAVATQRDSLVQRGDSTDVISTIGSPLIDSLRQRHGDSAARVPGAILEMSSKVLTSALRLRSEQELHRLKARLEGKPMPDL
jgi:uncharacterized protein YndB with AHSA1/START domain